MPLAPVHTSDYYAMLYATPAALLDACFMHMHTVTRYAIISSGAVLFPLVGYALPRSLRFLYAMPRVRSKHMGTPAYFAAAMPDASAFRLMFATNHYCRR